MVRVETHAAPAMGKCQESGTMNSGQKNNHLLLHPMRIQRLTRNDRTADEQAMQKKDRFLCRFRTKCAIFRHVIVGIIPCVTITTLKQYPNMAIIANTDIDAEEKPSKKSKKRSAEGSVALLKETIQMVCVSQDSYPKMCILRNVVENWNRMRQRDTP